MKYSSRGGFSNPDFFYLEGDSIENIGDAISDVLDVYSTEVLNAVNSEVDAAAKELKDAISSSAPVGTTKKQKRSWKVSEPDKRRRRVYGARLIVHSTDYRKVHLLEKGHLSRDGITRTKAFRYVSKSEEKILGRFAQKVENAIKAVK